MRSGWMNGWVSEWVHEYTKGRGMDSCSLFREQLIWLEGKTWGSRDRHLEVRLEGLLRMRWWKTLDSTLRIDLHSLFQQFVLLFLLCVDPVLGSGDLSRFDLFPVKFCCITEAVLVMETVWALGAVCLCSGFNLLLTSSVVLNFLGLKFPYL